MQQFLLGASYVFGAGLVLGLLIIRQACAAPSKKSNPPKDCIREFVDDFIAGMLGYFLSFASAIGLVVCLIIRWVTG